MASPESVPTASLDAVVAALDDIFEPANRNADAFLRSIMTSQLCVPIEALLTCERLDALRIDQALLTEAVGASHRVSLDASGTMVKPNDVAAARNTLVLRDVVEGTKAEEVAAIFGGDACPRPRSPVRAESAGSWVVTFDDEESCLAALEAVRNQVVCGAPVRARVRSEDLLRSLPAPGADAEQPGASGGAAQSSRDAPERDSHADYTCPAQLLAPSQSAGDAGAWESDAWSGGGWMAAAFSIHVL